MRVRNLIFFTAALTLAGATFGLVGCGGDDSSGGNPDSGSDVTNPPPPPPPNPPPPPGTDGGDAGCKFNDFVLGLISAHTDFTSQPSVDLGDNCVDDQTPFPASTF